MVDANMFIRINVALGNVLTAGTYINPPQKKKKKTTLKLLDFFVILG